MKRVYYMLFGLILALAVAVMACGASPSPAPTTPASPPTTTASPPATPTSPTIGQFAEAGKTVFTNSCKCHGAQGQGVTGPAVIGASASLDKYATAQGLLDFLSSVMPLNAPGSLPREQYQQVLCFLLVQNNYATPGTVFDPNQLKNITLQK